MKDYAINIFWSEEDDCYVADIPDLKYCSAFGDTPEEALSELLIAKRCGLKSHTYTATPFRSPPTAP